MDYMFHGILQARILEWVAIPFSSGSSQSRDRTQVSHIAGGFFTSWATREAQEYWSGQPIPSPVDLLNLGIDLGSPALQADSLPIELSCGSQLKYREIWVTTTLMSEVIWALSLSKGRKKCPLQVLLGVSSRGPAQRWEVIDVFRDKPWLTVFACFPGCLAVSSQDGDEEKAQAST